MRRILLIAGVATIAVLAAGFSAPAWLSELIVQLAPRYGVEVRTLALSRVGLRGLHATRVEAAVGTDTISGRDVEIAWEPLELLVEGRVRAVRAAALTIEVGARDPTRDTTAAALPQPLALAGLLPELPALTLPLVELRAPALGFAGAGEVIVDDERLAFAFAAKQPEEAAPFALRGSVTSSGLVDVVLVDSDAPDAPVLDVSSTLHDAHIELTGKLALTGYPLALVVRENTGLPAGAGRVSGEFTGVMPWPPAGIDTLRGAGSFVVQWQDGEERFAVQEVRARMAGSAADIAFELEGGRLSIAAPATTVTVPPGLKGRVQDNRIEVAGAGLLARIALEAGPVELRPERIVATLGQVLTLQVDGELRAPTVASAWLGELIGDFTSTSTLRSEALYTAQTWLSTEIDLQLRLGEQRLPVAVSVSGSNDELRTVADANGELALAPLAGLLQPWPDALVLMAGDVQYTFNAASTLNIADDQTSEPVFTGEGRTVLTGLRGSWDGDPFTDLAGDLRLSLDGADVVLIPSPVSIASVDVGVAVRDISAKLDGTTTHVAVRDGRLNVLGGSGRVEDFVYDVDADRAAFAVQLENLDLAEVLALEGDKVAGTGRLTGSLPVRYSASGVAIDSGVLSSVEGGTIHLSTDLARATGQPGLDFALKALTDFRYQSLSSQVDLADDGDLLFAVSLLGLNPEVEDGRPIQYNLNVTENIYALLDSLRTQRALTDALERKLNERRN